MVEAGGKEKVIELRDAFAVLVKRRWYIIVPFVLVVGAAIGVSLWLTPEYESHAILSYNNSPSLIKPLSSMVTSQSSNRMSGDDRRRMLAAMRNEITSSRVLSRLIIEMGLGRDPDIDKAALRLRAANPTLPLEQIKRDLVIDQLREAVVVELVGRDQLSIGVFDPDPFMAQRMADRLTDIYIEERVLQDLGSVREAQQLTDDQLNKFERQLDDLVEQKTNSEKEFLKMKIDESIISEDNRRAISKAIDEVTSEISELNREEVALLGGMERSVSLELKASSSLLTLRNELREDSRSLVNLMSKYTWSDRIVLNETIELNRKLVAAEEEIGVLVNARHSSESAESVRKLTRYYVVKERLNFLHVHREALQASFATVQRTAQQVPVARARLDQLEREVSAARKNLELFREQETSNQIRQDIIHSASSRYQIVEPATTPLAPSRPNKVKIGVMGAVLGIILGGAAALIAELLDTSFRKVEDVEKELGLPVLATIPEIESIR